MHAVFRVLDPTPCTSLKAYVQGGGGRAFSIARSADPAITLAVLADAGLRGRGGAGFPTATKWQSIVDNASVLARTPVIVNAAEGEPSTFKDRAILRNNPYRVIEGALVACAVIAADELIFCMKTSFEREWERVELALNDVQQAGWLEGIHVRLVGGPDSYLFGEETALLEVIGGRQPFPRVTPPWRRGIAEVADGTEEGGPAATASMATSDGDSGGAPALVNNVETFANVALIVRNGSTWFREMGTEESPGTIVCTVIGDVVRHGVGEFPMGTPLRAVLAEIGGDAAAGRRITGVLPGASSALITEKDLDVPLTHEAVRAIGSALGSAGFRCIDDIADPFLLVQSASRFLSVESCGQCLPCKEDGQALTALFDGLVAGTAASGVEGDIERRLATVTDGARCSLATQQRVVLRSLVDRCAVTVLPPRTIEEAVRPGPPLIVPILDIVDGRAILDDRHREKNFDWSFGPEDSGVHPAQLLQNVAVATEVPLTV